MDDPLERRFSQRRATESRSHGEEHPATPPCLRGSVVRDFHGDGPRSHGVTKKNIQQTLRVFVAPPFRLSLRAPRASSRGVVRGRERRTRRAYRTSSNSTSNSSTAFGGMSPPAPRAP